MNNNENSGIFDLSVILPTYNESNTIEKMLDLLKTTIPSEINTEVIVIDDDSPDKTSNIVTSYIQKSTGKISNRIQTILDQDQAIHYLQPGLPALPNCVFRSKILF